MIPFSSSSPRPWITTPPTTRSTTTTIAAAAATAAAAASMTNLGNLFIALEDRGYGVEIIDEKMPVAIPDDTTMALIGIAALLAVVGVVYGLISDDDDDKGEEMESSLSSFSLASIIPSSLEDDDNDEKEVENVASSVTPPPSPSPPSPSPKKQQEEEEQKEEESILTPEEAQNEEEKEVLLALQSKNQSLIRKTISSFISFVRTETKKQSQIQSDLRSDLDTVKRQYSDDISDLEDKYEQEQNGRIRDRAELRMVQEELVEVKVDLEKKVRVVERLEGERKSLRKLSGVGLRLIGRRVRGLFGGDGDDGDDDDDAE